MENKYAFNFPPNKRAGSVAEQLKHAAGEIVEASFEEGNHWDWDQIMEILDAIECLEGALRNFDLEDVQMVMAKHHCKNFHRGDYELDYDLCDTCELKDECEMKGER